MKRSPIWLLALYCALGSGAAIADGDQNDLQELLQYAGIYRLNSTHLVSIDVMTRNEDAAALVYTDLDTYQVRRLFRTGPDQFTAGTAFSLDEPEQYRFHFSRDANGAVASLEWTDAALNRGQSGKREPLRREDVAFSNGSVTLRGTLHLPACNRARLPLVVWVHGSSRAQRHGLFGLPQILAYHGVAVLAYDKRGVGASEGDYLTAGFDELASDAAAALVAMRERSDIDANRMGLMGTSQGGWIAFHTAALSKHVNFIVDLYGTPVPVADQVLYDLERDLQAHAVSNANRAAALSLQRAALEYMKSGDGWDALRVRVEQSRDQPWFRYVFISYQGELNPDIRSTGVAKMLRYEPLADIRRFPGPVLYMLGDFDRLVDVERSVRLMESTLANGASEDFTTVVMPKAHHGLTLGVVGDADERYGNLDDSKVLTSLAPGYPEIVLRWLRTRVGPFGRCDAGAGDK